jgi:hypothetical protein
VRGVFLPGGSQVDIREVADPRAGHGQVVIAMRASTICGSDLRAIYREHLGSGPEAYQGVIGGHEPSGVVEAIGPGVNRIRPGDRVVVYHISGCGQCDECRRGYQISCGSPQRAAYGWQRDGGHADKLLAEERDLLVLPDGLEFLDGACVACGFGTAYEALCRTEISGRDRVLVTGLGLRDRSQPGTTKSGAAAGGRRCCARRSAGRAERRSGGWRRGGSRLLRERGRPAHGAEEHQAMGSGGTRRRGGPAHGRCQRGVDTPPAHRSWLLGFFDLEDV